MFRKCIAGVIVGATKIEEIMKKFLGRVQEAGEKGSVVTGVVASS